jgi:ribonuclease P protein component
VRAGLSSPVVVVRAAVGWPSELVTSMLPRTRRLRTAADFTATVRRGRRCSTDLLTVHASFDGSALPPRAGVVVTRTVGIAVVRNRVKRRIRAALYDVGSTLPGGRVVVRALPPAALASFAQLETDLQYCLNRLRAAPA